MSDPDDMDIKAVSMQLSKNRTTISRWLHDGVVNNQTGIRIYLRYEMDGGRVNIKREWVSEFIRALQPIRGDDGGECVSS